MKLNWRTEDRHSVGLYAGQCRIGCVDNYATDDSYVGVLFIGPEKEVKVCVGFARVTCKYFLEAAARRALENDEILDPDELAELLNGSRIADPP